MYEPRLWRRAGEGPRVAGSVWDFPCLGLISRFLSLGLSGFGGSPRSSFPSRDGDFFPRIVSHRAPDPRRPSGRPSCVLWGRAPAALEPVWIQRRQRSGWGGPWTDASSQRGAALRLSRKTTAACLSILTITLSPGFSSLSSNS